MNALRDLFEATGQYMAHGYCFRWTPWIFWSYVLSDMVTSLSYTSDFFALCYLWRRRHDIQQSWIIPAFGVFILTCGVVHGLLVVSIFRGIYDTVSIAKVTMALVSAPVAVLAWPVIFHLVKLPSLEAYRVIERAYNDKGIENAELRKAVQSMAKEIGLMSERIGILKKQLNQKG